jgi:GDP-mannose pyrophosphatase NudK
VQAQPANVEKMVFFTCAYSPADKVSNGGGLKEEGEDIEVVETTLPQAAAMIAPAKSSAERRSFSFNI